MNDALGFINPQDVGRDNGGDDHVKFCLLGKEKTSEVEKVENRPHSASSTFLDLTHMLLSFKSFPFPWTLWTFS